MHAPAHAKYRWQTAAATLRHATKPVGRRLATEPEAAAPLALKQAVLLTAPPRSCFDAETAAAGSVPGGGVRRGRRMTDPQYRPRWCWRQLTAGSWMMPR